VTNDAILSIATPTEISQLYYLGDIGLGAIPADTATVTTHFPLEDANSFLHPGGMEYYLSRRKGTWGVRDSTRWME
jgi:hypothetical protein